MPFVNFRMLAPVLVCSCLFVSSLEAQARTWLSGDCNRSDEVDISDAIGAIGYLFRGDEEVCDVLCDVNGDGRLDLADPITLLRFLFHARATLRPAPAVPEETCNGRDDDCDGVVDEGCDPVDPVDPGTSLGISLISYGSDWKFAWGDSAAPFVDWHRADFVDDAWTDVRAAVGIGDEADGTQLNDFVAANSFFLRREFNVEDMASIRQISLEVKVDDGFVSYLNGVEVARFNVGSDSLYVSPMRTANWPRDARIPISFDLSDSIDLLKSGNNVFTVQVHNEESGSLDMAFDMKLVASGVDQPPFSVAADRSPLEVTATARVNAVEVQWVSRLDADVTSFEIERSTNVSQGFTTLARSSQLMTYRDTSVQAGSAYYYRIRALDADGEIAVSPTLGALPFSSQQAIFPRIDASRLRGVAPLHVFFDATGTQVGAGDANFHDLEYSWDFSDASDETWAISGKSKGRETGPLAAHVFEKPGSYAVQLSVRDRDGRGGLSTVVIVVDDPDVVFAGDKTICFSTSGNFSGSPPGSIHVRTSDSAEASRYVAPGRRLLFRRGERWSSEEPLRVNSAGPGIVGAFGTGAKPEFSSTAFSVVLLSGHIPEIADWRIVDLSLTLDGVGLGISAAGTVRQTLLFRCEVESGRNSYVLADDVVDHWFREGRAHTIHDDLTLVECSLRNSTSVGAYIASERLAIMGCYFEKTGTHVLRTPFLERAVIAHNYLGDSGENQHVMKIHAPTYSGDGLLRGRWTHSVVIRQNVIRSVDNAWTVVLAPQNQIEDERLRRFLIESNIFMSGHATWDSIRVMSSDTVIRNNLFLGSAATRPETVAIRVSEFGLTPDPVDVRVLNNSAYAPGTAGFRFLVVGARAVNISAHNNLVFALSNRARLIEDNSGVLSSDSNLMVSRSPFVSDTPASRDDFYLPSASFAIDAGRSNTFVFSDFDGQLRDGRFVPDVGAFEFVGEKQ